MNLLEIEKISDFYQLEISEIIDEHCIIIKPMNPVHGLFHDTIEEIDFDSISKFGKIIKNYKRLKRISDGK